MKKSNFIRISLMLLVGCFILNSPLKSFALQPQNPTTLCDRFLAGPERTACEKKMKTLAPDWYLAAVCAKQFDDHAFYECLELSKTTAFSPKKLEACDEEGFSDQSRIACIKNTKVSSSREVYQAEAPAKKRSAPQGSRRLSADGF
jgi:hypothetical protein